ncbi:MAG: heme exporter protein CcmB [Gemmatimonadota bacterium]|nr:MAG: heme exporter protein CcmB [Gemmatimonadota bacterium]
MDYLRVVWTVAGKDLLIEFRTRERVVAMGSFVVLVGVLFNYSIDTAIVRPQEIAPGMIWMTIILGGLLGVGRTFHLEEEDGAFSGVLQAPIPLDALYLGKMIANLVILGVVTVLTFVVFGLFFDLQFGSHPFVLGTVVVLGLVGFVGLLTLFSAMSARSTMGESLLPILVFPLLVPMVIFGVSATNRLLAGRPVSEVAGNVRMLGAFAILSVAAGAILFRHVVEE